MKRVALYLLTAAAALAGCSDEREGTPQVRVVPEIETRVTGMYFDAQDCIGLTIVRSAGVYVENAKLTYDGNAFSASGLLWYADRSEGATFVAYYPYAAEGAPDRFAVATDQRQGVEASDLLAAVKRDVVPGSAPVAMTFRHLLSQLTVVVTNEASSSVTEVAVGGFVPEAEVDLEAQAVSVRQGAAAQEVLACEVTPGARYRAILVPQRAQLEVRVTTADGTERSRTLTEALLEGGKRYDLSIVVTEEDIALALSGEIEDWGEGGQLGGSKDDEGDDEEKKEPADEPSGEAGTVEVGGVSYPTVVIDGREWMARNLGYLPSGAVLGNGVWYPADGADAVATQGLLYDYATAAGSEAEATEGPVRGICPAGWHIPDIEELKSLAAAGGDFFAAAGYWIPSLSAGSDGKYGAAEKGYLMGAPLTLEGRFNCWAFGEGVTPALSTTVKASYGISLRCVKDR